MSGERQRDSEVLAALLASEPDVADREELAGIVRNAAKLKAFVEIVKVRCARRSKQLATGGHTASATELLIEEGRRSGKEAHAVSERDRVCTEFPGSRTRSSVATSRPITSTPSPAHQEPERPRSLRSPHDHRRCHRRCLRQLRHRVRRNTRNQLDVIKAMNRPRDDEERAKQQRAESRISSRVDHHEVHEGGRDLESQPDRTATWFRPDRTTWWSGNSTNRRTRSSSGANEAARRGRPPDQPPSHRIAIPTASAPQLTLY